MRTEAILAYFKILSEVVTFPPSVNRFYRENVGDSTSHNPVGLHGLLTGTASPFFSFTSVVVVVDLDSVDPG
jgi:hypothetical protein